MWKVKIEDNKYNCIEFEFKSLNEAGDFVKCAIDHSNELKVTIVTESDGEKNEHK